MFARTWNTWGSDGRNSVVLENFDENDLPEALHQFDVAEWKGAQNEVLEVVYPAVADRIREQRNSTAKSFASRHHMIKEKLVGDTVLVFDERRTNKNDPRWVGPYSVQVVNETGSYVVVDAVGHTLRRTRPQLRLISSSNAKADSRANETVNVDDDDKEDTSPLDSDVYVVERIIKHCVARKKADHPNNYQFLIKWKGYPHSKNTWEPRKNIHDGDLISKYLKTKRPERSTKKRQQAAWKDVQTKSQQSRSADGLNEPELKKRKGH
jgi:hypothetical protein